MVLTQSASESPWEDVTSKDVFNLVYPNGYQSTMSVLDKDDPQGLGEPDNEVATDTTKDFLVRCKKFSK